jgi:hypothetical protein
MTTVDRDLYFPLCFQLLYSSGVAVHMPSRRGVFFSTSAPLGKKLFKSALVLFPLPRRNCAARDFLLKKKQFSEINKNLTSWHFFNEIQPTTTPIHGRDRGRAGSLHNMELEVKYDRYHSGPDAPRYRVISYEHME